MGLLVSGSGILCIMTGLLILQNGYKLNPSLCQKPLFWHYFSLAPRISTNNFVIILFSEILWRYWLRWKKYSDCQMFQCTLPLRRITCSNQHWWITCLWNGRRIPWGDLYINNTFASFTQFQTKYHLPHSHFYFYLQIRHFTQVYIPEFTTKEPHILWLTPLTTKL